MGSYGLVALCFHHKSFDAVSLDFNTGIPVRRTRSFRLSRPTPLSAPSRRLCLESILSVDGPSSNSGANLRFMRKSLEIFPERIPETLKIHYISPMANIGKYSFARAAIQSNRRRRRPFFLDGGGTITCNVSKPRFVAEESTRLKCTPAIVSIYYM